MTIPHISINAMTFDVDGDPATVTATFPAETLYILARVFVRLSQTPYTPKAQEHLFELYNFVSGHIANHYFDAGLDDNQMPFVHTGVVGNLPVTLRPDGDEIDRLATLIRRTITLREEEDPTMAHDPEALAAALADVLTAKGYRSCLASLTPRR